LVPLEYKSESFLVQPKFVGNFLVKTYDLKSFVSLDLSELINGKYKISDDLLTVFVPLPNRRIYIKRQNEYNMKIQTATACQGFKQA
jgi:hypothetical protein